MAAMQSVVIIVQQPFLAPTVGGIVTLQSFTQ